LKSFACDGLRTLCLGVAQLSREKYNDWAAVRSAFRSIVFRSSASVAPFIVFLLLLFLLIDFQSSSPTPHAFF
jgi:hypothetical protein